MCSPRYLKSRKSSPEEFLWETIALCPLLQSRMRDAKLASPVTATGNYSYRPSAWPATGYVMVGDAFAFIDPVFSSGVFFAMNSALLGAETVDGSLRDPARRKALERQFDRTVRRGLSSFSWFIYRMTSPAIRDLLMAPRNYLPRPGSAAVAAGRRRLPLARRARPAAVLQGDLLRERARLASAGAWPRGASAGARRAKRCGSR